MPPTVRVLLDAAVRAVGGAERAGQVQMAEAVDASMRGGGHLLVQAGTGTGKSLAYLVPALLHTQRGGSTTARVVVATATIALQGQVIDRDLPRVVEALAPLLKRRPTFAMIKGRRNYVCLNKVKGGMPAEDADGSGALFAPEPASQLGRDVVRVRAWAERTGTGDRDELVPGVSDRAWSQVSVTAAECLGAAKCPYGVACHAERARAAAAEVDVVVTNHALLAIDAIEGFAVLPEHDVVVVDEGHELVDRVTAVATDELTGAAVDRAVRRARGAVAEAEASAVGDLAEAAAALTEALTPLPEGRLTSLPEALRTALVLIRDAARRAQSGLGRGAGGSGGEGGDSARRQVAWAALDAVHHPAERIVAGSGYDVVWVADEARRGKILKAAPLVVSGLLRDRLFGDRTVVLTSATLEIGGSFDLLARQVGLAQTTAGRAAPAGAPDPPGDDDTAAPDEPTWRGLDVGSPFNYPRQGILYVARHLPPPGRDGTSPAALEELAGLIEAAGGRTLGLFSSMRAATAAAAALRERLQVPILCQGEDTTAELVRRFAADAPSCLFGTLSLWQGVDVPGSALQLVAIDRIPFPRPDDPLMSARQRAVDEAGGNGFMTVAAAHAGLRLAQGAGRLIRSVDDRGVVAVLDSRLATARYGAFLRATLPPLWFTTDPAQVRRSLAALAVSAAAPLPVRPVSSRPAAPAPAAPAPAAPRPVGLRPVGPSRAAGAA
jgi:ATP-dependent DNA helicase DinG